MNNRAYLTRALAVTGTVLVWPPLLAPLFFGIVSLIGDGVFRFDYLMPAELFPLAMAGGVLLLCAAWRSRSHRRLFAWSLALAVVALAGSQGLAVVTGLASGETAIGGWQWVLVLALLAIYTLAVAIVAVAAIWLLRDLFRPPAAA